LVPVKIPPAGTNFIFFSVDFLTALEGEHKR
jgi:hypothetical protein